jgi:hypothetical protein
MDKFIESDNIKIVNLCPTCFYISITDYYFIPLFSSQYNPIRKSLIEEEMNFGAKEKKKIR